ncbi:hypothetical protein [Deinococcus ruber]|uniref:hypothetical protein n=1 Tax=Deinococcus ruber TaxID=1848197 RepID=UPI001664B9A5|nr:hypothetical protein [Deinococcus ruber]
MSVPSSLIALPPPENGDGQTWQSRDRQVQVLAWGSYSPAVLNLNTPHAAMVWLVSAEQQNGSRVTYRFVGSNRVVLSGFTRSGQVFYQLVRVRAGSESGVRIEYAPRLKAVWDARAAQIAATLTPPNAL